MKKILNILTVLLFFMILSGCDEGLFVVSQEPAPPVEYRPVRPYPDYIWIQGEWIRSSNNYVWRNGYWTRPRPHEDWEPGHWEHHQNGYHWNKGHWNNGHGDNGHRDNGHGDNGHRKH